MDSLFAQPQKKPLADRMRPTRLSDFVGQETAVGERSPLRRNDRKGSVAVGVVLRTAGYW